MKKNIKSGLQKPKSFLENFGLLLIGLSLIGLIYGGLSISKLSKQNQVMSLKQVALENKVIDLESQIIDNQNKISQVTGDLEKTNLDLAKSKKDVAYFRQLALEQKQVFEEKNASASISTDQAINIIPAVKTITKVNTKKIYVKEKPKYEASVTVKNVGSYKVPVVSGDTALSVLKKTADQNNFAIETQSFDFGAFVSSIGGIKPVGNQYWAFYYNGKYAEVGASDQKVSSGDTTFWQLESF